MRFITHINNVKCLEWGINPNQGAVFDLFNQMASWATATILDGVTYYWISREKVVEELPLYCQKTDTVYRYFKDFAEKGLILYQKIGNQDLISITEKGAEWNSVCSDFNPTFGNKSEQTRKSIRKSSDLNPTNNNTNYKNTNDHNNTLTGINAHARETKKSAVLVLLEQFGITGQLAEDFIAHRKAKKAPINETALKGFQREADKAGIPIQRAVEIAIERNWQGFKANWDWGDGFAKPNQNTAQHAKRGNPSAPIDWSGVVI